MKKVYVNFIVLVLFSSIHFTLPQSEINYRSDEGMVNQAKLTNMDIIDFSMPQDSIIWFEDFEDDIAGQFPTPNWDYTGNSNISVDNTISVIGQHSLKIAGSIGGCWEAIPCRLMEVSTSVGFTIQFYIRISSDHQQGCHSWTGGAGMMTICSWTSGQGAGIIGFDYNSIISSRIGNLGNYSYDTWYKVKMKYVRMNANTVELTYWIDDVLVGNANVSAQTYEDDLTRFNFSSGDGTVWVDEIEVRDLSVTTSPVNGNWNELEVSGSLPYSRKGHTAIYDPQDERMIVFGGWSSVPYNSLNDVWSFDLVSSSWTQLFPTGGPPPNRAGHVAVYDSIRHRMIVFAGHNWWQTWYNDTWALDLTTNTWSQLSTTGGPPTNRFFHCGIYDAMHDKLIIFGGKCGSTSNNWYGNDTWTLNFATMEWEQLSTTNNPAPREECSAILDKVNNRMIIFGGRGSTNFSDTWALDLDTYVWTYLDDFENTVSCHASVFDPQNNQMVAVTGWGLYDHGQAAIFSTNDNIWLNLSVSGDIPILRQDPSVIWDPVSQRVIMFGGDDGTLTTDYNDTWEFTTVTDTIISIEGIWNELEVSGDLPYPRDWSAGIYDTQDDKMIVFGGWSGVPYNSLNDVWSFDPTLNSWTQLFPIGGPPPNRAGHIAVYDSLRHRMVVFGGANWWQIDYNDTWVLDLTTNQWIQLSTSGGPPIERFAHSGIYDSFRDRLLIFGGRCGWPSNSWMSDETWALNLTNQQWVQLSTTNNPPPRECATAIYDKNNDRLILFGGNDLSNQFRDTWELNLNTNVWTYLGDFENTVTHHLAVYNQQLGRMIALVGWTLYDHGQAAVFSAGGDTWLNLSISGSIPSPRGRGAAVWDSQRQRALLFGGGVSLTENYNDTWELLLSGTASTSFQLTVSINDGWNMVSVPGINSAGMGVGDWWSDLAGTVYKFVPGFGYVGITTTVPTEGYWLKNVGATVYNYPAIDIVTHDPIGATAGWNMFGGYEDAVDVTTLTTTPADQILYPIYKFVPGAGYDPATTLDPGFGYWVKVATSCDINIPDVLAKGSGEVVEYFKEDWGRIVITDATGKSYTLYAVKGDSPNGGASVDLDRYELPPMPPQGMFDIRYGSGRIAEDINGSIQTIEMSGIKYPVRVKVENMIIKLQDESGKVVNEELEPGDEITIDNIAINKLLVLSGEFVQPIEFALEQNYPNPFNPITTIKFSIRQEVQVNLSVFNILGEKVTELKNEVMKPGYYEVEFNASKFASGVYLYRIKAGDFVETKKMILLK